MKRSGLIILALFGVLFALVGILKYNRKVDVQLEASRDPEGRQVLVRFWEAYHKATKLRSAQRYGDAAAGYLQALEKDPEHEESLYYLGNCLLELGEFKSALEIYRRLVKVNPRSHRGFSQLGVTLSTLEPGSYPDYTEARRSFERVVEIDPEESGPLLRLGWLSLRENKLEEAYEYFQKAAGFASPEGHFWSGFVRFQQQRYSEAIDHFMTVASIAAHEKRIAGRGGRSEGDRGGLRAGPLSPLKKAELKARLFLHWSVELAGGQTSELDESIRLGPTALARPQKINLSPEPPGESLGPGCWGDFNGDGTSELAIANGSRIAIYRHVDGGFVRTAELDLSQDMTAIWELTSADFNRDGFDDLYAVRGGFWGTGPNRVLRCQASAETQLQFTDVTETVGLSGERSTVRTVVADLNGDGRIDLLELGNPDYGPPLRVYLGTNAGFRHATASMGTEFEGFPVDVAFGDIDEDADLDLYLLRWKRPGLLLRNNGQGSFTDATAEAGLKGVGGRGFSTLFFDYDQDGKQDLLVTTAAPYEAAIYCLLNPEVSVEDDTPRLFRNLGGRFEEVTRKVGLARSFGVFQAVATDFNRDGWPDLVFANGDFDNLHLEPSLVLKNERGSTFSDKFLIPGLMPAQSTGVSVGTGIPGVGTSVYVSGIGLYNLSP